MSPHRKAAAGDMIEGQIELRRKRTNAVGQHETRTRWRQVSHRAYDDGVWVVTPDYRLLGDPVPRIYPSFGDLMHRAEFHRLHRRGNFATQGTDLNLTPIQ
jgi:hypothetical protein